MCWDAEDIARDEYELEAMQERLAICACGETWLVPCPDGQPTEAVVCPVCGEDGEL